MHRCLQLAALAKHTAAPNPMVGCVVVHNDTIVGEGWHHSPGKPHAEVNALAAVTNPDLLKESTVYVSLEPCAHHGRTPPCADLLVKHQVKKVVIGCQDPFSKVNGAGIQKLKAAGIIVEVGVLEEECKALNKHFFTFHQKQRPFITLKWAQTLDGFFAKPKTDVERKPDWITGTEAKLYVHRLRAEHSAILVGSNTALHDDPQLTTRLIEGPSPMRMLLDRKGIVPSTSKLFTDGHPTLVFGEVDGIRSVQTQQLLFAEAPLPTILEYCHRHNFTSLMVEGGATLLQHFIDNNLWDEAHILIGPKTFGEGIKAPQLKGSPQAQHMLGDDHCLNYQNI